MEDKNSLEILLNNFMTTNNTDRKEGEKDTADKNIYTRQINALTSAIPFLNREYQKNIFLLVKFLEYKRFVEEMPSVSIQSKDKTMEYLNTSKMAEEVRKCLNQEERKQFDMFFRIFMLRNIAGGKKNG